jgi:hypothetical protein
MSSLSTPVEQELEERLHELDYLVPDPSPLLDLLLDLTVGLAESVLFKQWVVRRDWRPCFDLCLGIREAMKERDAFSSRAAREAFRARFREVQDRLYQARDAERDAFAAQSERLKEHFLLEFSSCHPEDAITEFLAGLATKAFGGDRQAEARDEMRDKGARLRELRQELRGQGAHLFKGDRDECFEALRQVEEMHDDFWAQYKEASQQRRAEREEKCREWEDRTRARIAKNQEELEAKESTLERIQANVEKLQEMLENARSEERKEQVEAWIVEAEEKKERLEQRIQRLEAWIEQDGERLNP